MLQAHRPRQHRPEPRQAARRRGCARPGRAGLRRYRPPGAGRPRRLQPCRPAGRPEHSAGLSQPRRPWPCRSARLGSWRHRGVRRLQRQRLPQRVRRRPADPVLHRRERRGEPGRLAHAPQRQLQPQQRRRRRFEPLRRRQQLRPARRHPAEVAADRGRVLHPGGPVRQRALHRRAAGLGRTHAARLAARLRPGDPWHRRKQRQGHRAPGRQRALRNHRGAGPVRHRRPLQHRLFRRPGSDRERGRRPRAALHRALRLGGAAAAPRRVALQRGGRQVPRRPPRRCPGVRPGHLPARHLQPGDRLHRQHRRRAVPGRAGRRGVEHLAGRLRLRRHPLPGLRAGWRRRPGRKSRRAELPAQLQQAGGADPDQLRGGGIPLLQPGLSRFRRLRAAARRAGIRHLPPAQPLPGQRQPAAGPELRQPVPQRLGAELLEHRQGWRHELPGRLFQFLPLGQLQPVGQPHAVRSRRRRDPVHAQRVAAARPFRPCALPEQLHHALG
ncbi:hypothetical protein D9M71_152160 [compost metagenome]